MSLRNLNGLIFAALVRQDQGGRLHDGSAGKSAAGPAGLRQALLVIASQ
jgi:hypothetical protein